MYYIISQRTPMIKNISIISIFFISLSTQASIWTAITGHAEDIKSRFESDQFIVENPQKSALKGGDIDEDAEGQDIVHNAKGSIFLVKKDNTLYVQLDKNFSSSLGPDYHVYFSDSTNNKNEDDFRASSQIELGRLKKGSGASYYPTNELSGNINSVTIWCKKFNEYIGSANLQ